MLGGTGETLPAKLYPAHGEHSGKGGHDCHQLSPAFWSLQLWVEERLPLAQSADYGTNLQTVQLFMKKNQVSPASPRQSYPPLLTPTWPHRGRPSPGLQKASNGRLVFLLAALGSPNRIGSLRAERAGFCDYRANSGRITEEGGILLLGDSGPFSLRQAPVNAGSWGPWPGG